MNLTTKYGEVVFNAYGSVVGVIHEADATYLAQYLYSDKSFFYSKVREHAVEWIKNEYEAKTTKEV